MKFRSKIEEEINNQLLNIFQESSGYEVKYQENTLSGSKYKLNIDFTIYYNSKVLIHIEYSGMNFFKKYLKLVDICKHHPIFVIFDSEDLQSQLSILEETLTLEWYYYCQRKEILLDPSDTFEDFLENNIFDITFQSNNKIFDKIKKFNDEISQLKKN